MKNTKRTLISSASIFLAVLFALMPLCGVKTRAEDVVRESTVSGDATGDCDVNTKDVLAIRRCLGGLDEETEMMHVNGDVNRNGELETKDVLMIRKYLGGLVTSLGPLYTIMSYNVGLWNDGSGYLVPENESERYVSLHKNIIDTYSPDILCIQEFCEDIIPGDGAATGFLSERFPYMVNAKGHTVPFNYVGKAICSLFLIEDSENDSLEDNPAHDSPNYEKAYVRLNGRRVCIISAHPAAHPYIALTEMNVIAEDLKDEEYFIVCVDTNVNVLEEEYDLALKAMFDVRGIEACFANGGGFGKFITYPRTERAIDNVITSTNIIIESVKTDKQKDEFFISDPDRRDHYPVIVELYVN